MAQLKVRLAVAEILPMVETDRPEVYWDPEQRRIRTRSTVPSEADRDAEEARDQADPEPEPLDVWVRKNRRRRRVT